MNDEMNPSANKSDAVITGRPRQSVAIHANTEDHRHSVRGEDLVVGFGREQREVGGRELRSHQHRFEPADDEKHERADDVAQSDRLVVHGREPTPERFWRFPQLRQPLLGREDSHCFIHDRAAICLHGSCSRLRCDFGA
jgi:hypothetical protein